MRRQYGVVGEDCQDVCVLTIFIFFFTFYSVFEYVEAAAAGQDEMGQQRRGCVTQHVVRSPVARPLPAGNLKENYVWERHGDF